MNDIDMISLGIWLAGTFGISLDDLVSLKFQIIPPSSPWIYRIVHMDKVGPFLFSETLPVEYEDIQLISKGVGDKHVRIGYSKRQNMVLIDPNYL